MPEESSTKKTKWHGSKTSLKTANFFLGYQIEGNLRGPALNLKMVQQSRLRADPQT